MPTNMADLSWRTGSIFSCCKGLWDCCVLKPITTKHQSVFWLCRPYALASAGGITCSGSAAPVSQPYSSHIIVNGYTTGIHANSITHTRAPGLVLMSVWTQPKAMFTLIRGRVPSPGFGLRLVQASPIRAFMVTCTRITQRVSTNNLQKNRIEKMLCE